MGRPERVYAEATHLRPETFPKVEDWVAWPVGRVVCPGDAQFAHIVAIDLFEGRIADSAAPPP